MLRALAQSTPPILRAIPPQSSPHAEIQLGAAEISLRDLGQLTKSILLLDGLVNDPVEIVGNGRVIARGQLCSLDGKVSVKISEVPQ